MPNEQTIENIRKYIATLGDIDAEIVDDALVLGSLHHQVDKEIENDNAMRGLYARQVVMIEQLFHNEPGTLTPAELADEASLTRSAMTSALDSLERAGYIFRSQHPSDRRSVVVSLTPEGVEFAHDILPHKYRKMQRIVGALTIDERKTLINAYTKLLDILRRELAED